MARKARLHVPGGFYHVTLRGNHRQPIFQLESDRDRLDTIVAEAAEHDGVTIHAYCWMTNHLHALIEVGDAPLGCFMQRVASRHARFVQRRSATTGHLFERRYHAVLVDTDRYLFDVVRYIHLNPVRGGLVTDPLSYPWSSHRDYLGLATQPWVHPQRTLAMLAKDLPTARKVYAGLVNAALGRPPPSPMLDLLPSDRRVLGGREFRARLLPPSRTDTSRESLSELIERTCAELQLPVTAVCSGARTPKLSAARAEIARRAVEGCVATRSEVARALGRSLSAVSQALDKARRRR